VIALPLGSRRTWLLASAALGTLLTVGQRGGGRAATLAADAAAEGFIGRAFEMRRRAAAGGDQPYGAVVVKDGRIIGEAPSRVVTAGDPTAHAEIEAIRDAATRLGAPSLNGCVLYSSSRPCPMCEAAAYWAGISRLIHGAEMTDRGSPRLSRC
jgi:tRNA(Arg) A34 adenosine deaminase TadA